MIRLPSVPGAFLTGAQQLELATALVSTENCHLLFVGEQTLAILLLDVWYGFSKVTVTCGTGIFRWNAIGP